MCDIFMMCFVLFLFVTCFGWNFNPIAAAAALGYMAAAALGVFSKSFHYSTCLSSIFSISFHISTKTKHIMKISHINVNIYDKTATSQQNSDQDVE
jgi:ABC-type phosphate transport system permease subunit